MIRLLARILDGPARRRLVRFVAGSTAAAVASGLTFVLLVPLLGALFRGDTGAAWSWLGVVAAAFVVSSVVDLWAANTGTEVGTDLVRTVLRRVGDHVAALPLAWFGPERTGSLGRMAGRGVVDVAMIPAHLLRPLVTAVVTPSTLVLAMLVLDPRMGVALLVCVPVVVLGSQALAFMVGRSEAAAHAAAADASARIVEFARHQAVLRSAGRAVEGHAQVGSALHEQYRAGRRLLLGGSAGMGVFLLILQLVLTGVLAWGVFLVLGAGLGVPELLALLVLTARSVDPLVHAAELSGSLRMGTEALRRVVTLLETPPLLEPAVPPPPPEPAVPVELHEVTFAYEGAGAEPVLRDVSFTVPAGTTTAIVGPSGAGKTTVTRLVARFADVDAGAVRLGGHDVRDLGSAGTLARVAIVFQDVYLFDDTLRENVRIGRPDADDAAVEHAARLARVDEIVERLPRGWDTPVGEGGTALSGGERQRVSIARALLKDAPVVLLDEATAALDPENEAAVGAALAAVGADRTVLVVAHRLSTIRSADHIVVLDEGRVVERGTHDDLIAAGGLYAGLWRRRERAEGWRLAPSGTVPSTTGPGGNDLGDLEAHRAPG